MKKILIILSLSLLSLCLSAQNYNKKGFRVGTTTSWVSSTSFDTKVYNVLDYGVHADGLTNDAGHIRSAVDAAEAVKGTVYVPAGEYLVTDSIILKPETTLIFDNNAHVFVPAGYKGCVFYSGSTGTSALLLDSWVIGGSFDERAAKLNLWTLIKFEKNLTGNNSYAMRNHFKNITVEDCRYVVWSKNSSEGWTNGNVFEDLWCWQPNSLLNVNQVVGSDFSANIFSNINVQAGSNTVNVIDTLFGNRNKFTNIEVWDWNLSADPTKPYMIIGANANNTVIMMPQLEADEWINLGGNYNVVYTNKYISQNPYYGNVTDGAPTDAEIDAVIGNTAAEADYGFKAIIYDGNGSALMYMVTSDGTYWYYAVMTKAL